MPARTPTFNARPRRLTRRVTTLAVAGLLAATASGVSPWSVASAAPAEADADGDVRLIPFKQRYRMTADDVLRDSLRSNSERSVAVPAGSLVTSIARTPDGRWLKVRPDGRTVTGFLRADHVERLANRGTDDPLAGIARRSATGLDVNELARDGKIAQRHALNEAQRREARLRAEQQRVEAEMRRLEREQRERDAELAAQQEQLEREARAAEYAGNQSSGVDWDFVAGYALDAIDEVNQITRETAQETDRLTQQAWAAKARQIEAERQQQQRDAERRRSQLEQQQREAERRRSELAQRQARQQDIERQRQATRQRQQELERQRQIAERQQQALEQQRRETATRLASSTTAGRSAGVGSRPSSPSPAAQTQKVYEPMPETVTGENGVWFSDRDQAIFLARLQAVNRITSACRERDARADRPATDAIRNGDAPPRWTFSNPDCRQGGWDDEEWTCRANVAGTCYRRQ